MEVFVMDRKETIELLEEKFKSDGGKIRRIMLDGPWGVGKTHAVAEFLEKADTFKVINVSLFGVDSTSALLDEIAVGYLENHATTKMGKSIARNILPRLGRMLKIEPSLFGIGINVDGVDTAGATVSLVDETCLLCFDDLERKSAKINMEDVLGIVERLALKTNVLLIGNKDEMNDADKEQYEKFREKIIDKERMEWCLTYTS